MLSYSPFCFSVHLTSIFFFFFFNDPATTEIYTLSLHYALPISVLPQPDGGCRSQARLLRVSRDGPRVRSRDRKSTRLNSSHRCISYAVFCLKKKKKNIKRVAQCITFN